MEGRKNIVIIGAGFAGLRTALLVGAKLKKLGLETGYRIVLIDRNEYHTYTPALYEIAANDPEHTSYEQLREIVTFPIARLIAGLPIEHVYEQVISIDIEKQNVTCETERVVPYHYLILAPGSESNYFDIPGLAELSVPLKTFRDSIEIREYILNAMHGKTGPVQVVVGGAGTAGVEVAGEIRSWLNRIHAESRGSRRFEVSIIETTPTILAPFPKKVIEKATKRLVSLGVKLITNERITSVRQGMISLATGRAVPFDVLIWTGGVKANALMQTLPLTKDVRGRVLVSPTMECSPSSPITTRLDGGKIYGLGDAVTIIDPITKQPSPGTAQVALTQADIAAHNIVTEIQLQEGLTHKPEFAMYQWRDGAYIIPLGGFFAVARIRSLVIVGIFGWLLKQLVKLRYFMSLMPLSKALSIFWKSLKIILNSNRIHRSK